jgi:hypothetical protein
MSVKKKCWDCKALEEFHYRGWCCQLKYKILTKRGERKDGKTIWYPMPEGKCPKPRTNKKFIELYFGQAERGE